MSKFQAAFLIALSGMLYGALSYFGTVLVDAHFSVNSMLFWRFLVATIILFPLGMQRGIRLRMTKREFVENILFGAFFYGASSVFYFLATPHIGTGLAIVIFFLYPIFVMFLGWYFDDQVWTRTGVGSILLIISGLTLLHLNQEMIMNFKGVALTVLAAAFYGGYVYMSKKRMKNMRPFDSAFLLCSSSTIGFGLLCMADSTMIWPQNFVDWKNIVLIGIFCTALPILFLLEGLKYVGANQASVLSVLEPIVTLILGILLLEEVLNWVQVVGAIIILIGATLIQFEKTPSALPEKRLVILRKI